MRKRGQVFHYHIAIFSMRGKRGQVFHYHIAKSRCDDVQRCVIIARASALTISSARVARGCYVAIPLRA
jgi:hypothetical protein